MTIGDIQAFIQYSRQFTDAADADGRRCSTCCSRAWPRPSGCSTCSTPTSSPRHRRRSRWRRAPGRVEFDDVSFSYDPGKPLIEDLSLVAEPGQTIAIVGPTGAGKTTLVNLIMRFYELDGGRITLDGRDIARCAATTCVRHIGMVLQDTWLFGGTIRDNIAYGNPTPPRSRSSRPPGPPTSTGSCTRCPTATTRSSTTRAAA